MAQCGTCAERDVVARGMCQRCYGRWHRSQPGRRLPAPLRPADLLGEQWRPCTEAAGYWVSNLGRVRGYRGGLLKPLPIGRSRERPYLAVNIYPQRRVSIHRLVTQAFHGPAPSAGHEVAHWNGDPMDNRAANLRWATKAENTDDRYRHGTLVRPVAKPRAGQGRARGADHYRAKLTDDAVRAIRAALATSESKASIARRFGVSYSTIAFIAKGTTWKHVD